MDQLSPHSSLRDLLLTAAPDTVETFRWAQPVYEFNGPFCFIEVFKDHVNLGFWRGTPLPISKGLFAGRSALSGGYPAAAAAFRFGDPASRRKSDTFFDDSKVVQADPAEKAAKEVEHLVHLVCRPFRAVEQAGPQ